MIKFIGSTVLPGGLGRERFTRVMDRWKDDGVNTPKYGKAEYTNGSRVIDRRIYNTVYNVPVGNEDSVGGSLTTTSGDKMYVAGMDGFTTDDDWVI